MPPSISEVVLGGYSPRLGNHVQTFGKAGGPSDLYECARNKRGLRWSAGWIVRRFSGAYSMKTYNHVSKPNGMWFRCNSFDRIIKEVE
jgi:hypothetical protein